MYFCPGYFREDCLKRVKQILNLPIDNIGPGPTRIKSDKNGRKEKDEPT